MKILKTLFISIILLLMSTALALAAPQDIDKEAPPPPEEIKELKVGGPMPDFYEHKGYIGIINPWTGTTAEGEPNRGFICFLYKSEDTTLQNMVGSVSTLWCNAELIELPFGVFSVENKKLYLDNSPTDGIIDEIRYMDTNATSSPIYLDAPSCDGTPPVKKKPEVDDLGIPYKGRKGA